MHPICFVRTSNKYIVLAVGILLLLSYMVKLGGQHLLAMVNQNTLKEKTSSGMQGVNNEWCTLLHLLGCCLLSQAHLQSSWGSTEKKVNEAISCFFLG
ncbi:nuclear pore complex protein NUP160-like [Lactuca sativa]|uniref:nuclear pore complex protein NUP160-like n=1 Tax=Lactuca sativa TaxID=4236 RepID=UPI0022AE5EAB|nr:nuclear pore complex protein NUP160-like [Lactuca sativa]